LTSVKFLILKAFSGRHFSSDVAWISCILYSFRGINKHIFAKTVI
jgi:hypothetical protein